MQGANPGAGSADRIEAQGLLDAGMQDRIRRAA